MVDQVDAGDQADELVAVEDDRHLVAVEHRQQGVERLVGLQRVQLARHGGADRRVEALPAAFIRSLDHRQDVALVDDADELAVVDAPAAARRRRGACGHRR